MNLYVDNRAFEVRIPINILGDPLMSMKENADADFITGTAQTTMNLVDSIETPLIP